MYLYRFIYIFLKLILTGLQPLISKKTQKFIQLRSDLNYLNYKIKNPIWFHASSGEIEYCKSVILELKNKNPNQKIILSYSSASAEKLLFNIKNSVDLIFPLPWDTVGSVLKILNHFEPQVIIFARTDFWPELVISSYKKNIPLIAISMFPQFNFINKIIYKWLLSKFTIITTVNDHLTIQLSHLLQKKVSPDFAIKFSNLSQPQILTVADTRFDQVFNRLEQPSRLLFLNDSTAQKRIIFASTWPEDELIIFKSFDQLIQLGFQIILCPHDIERSEYLLSYSKTNFNCYSVSVLSDFKLNTEHQILIETSSPIIILDQVGFLADVYRSTQFAFVGGSFKKRIHSVMEPLCAENIVMFGPAYANNPEAIESLEKKISFQIKTSLDILSIVTDETGYYKSIKAEIKKFTYSKKHASQNISHLINQLLNQQSLKENNESKSRKL